MIDKIIRFLTGALIIPAVFATIILIAELEKSYPFVAIPVLLIAASSVTGFIYMDISGNINRKK